jgi:hypothetical protein
MATTENKTFTDYVNRLDTVLYEYLVKKAPAIPPSGKNAVVMVIPWLTIVFFVIGLFPLITGGILSILTLNLNSMVATAVSLAIALIEVIAFPYLLKRQMRGWKLLFYAGLLNIVEFLLAGNIIGGILITLLLFYLLYQIKELYQ